MNARERQRRWMGTAVLALLCTASPASGQDRFDAAERAYAEGRIDDAIAAYTAILETPGNGPRDLHRVHLRLGLFHAVAGDAARAGEHFRVALALDPSTEAPSELNPELRRAFAEARPAELRVALLAPDPARDTATTVALELDESLRDLVAGFRVRALAGPTETWSSRAGGAATAFEVPASAWREGDLTVTADALDAYGGLLVSESLVLHVDVRARRNTVPIDPLRTGTSEQHEEDGSAWPWVLLGTGIAALIAGGLTIALVIALSEDVYVVPPPEVR